MQQSVCTKRQFARAGIPMQQVVCSSGIMPQAGILRSRQNAQSGSMHKVAVCSRKYAQSGGTNAAGGSAAQPCGTYQQAGAQNI
eukprot:1158571-Pelagomonas_calceolata.AAC.6